MRQSKKTIRAWIPVLDECVETWKMTVKDGKRGSCAACRAGELGWNIGVGCECECPLDAQGTGCCDGYYADWDTTRSTLDAKRVLAYIRKVRKQLEEALK